MRVRVYEHQDFHTTHERLALYEIVQELERSTRNTEPVWLFTNVQLPETVEVRSDGTPTTLRGCEPDLIVVKRSGILVVEMKNYDGVIEWPTQEDHKREAWFSTRAGVREELCPGFKSPLSQLWYNRRVVVASLTSMRSKFPSEYARTSAFHATQSALLFTNSGVSFKSPKPSFWKYTHLTTPVSVEHASSFDSIVAALTTPRRHHKEDLTSQICLEEEDIDFLISEFKLRQVATSELPVTDVPPPSFTATVHRERMRLSVRRQEVVRATVPIEELKEAPSPLKLLRFYKAMLDADTRRRPILRLDNNGRSDFFHVAGIDVMSLLSDDGIIVSVKSLPTWDTGSDIFLGMLILRHGNSDPTSASPLFVMPAEVLAETELDGQPMRRLRVNNDNGVDISRAALRLVPRFRDFEDDEIEEYLNTISDLPTALEQIIKVLTDIHGELPSLILGNLPSAPNEATLSAVYHRASAAYTQNLIRDLDELDRKWRGILAQGKVPQDMAWKILEKPTPHGNIGTWSPRKANVLPLNYEQSLAASMVFDHEIPIGVISGPPGTGKSQLIVNVLAEAHEQGATILFASNNNGAVDVVTKRLNEEILKLPIVVGLGSRKRIAETLDTLSSLSTGNSYTAAEMEGRLRGARKEIATINAKLRELDRAFAAYRANVLEEQELLVVIDGLLAECPELDPLFTQQLDHDQLKAMIKHMNAWKQAIIEHDTLVAGADSLWHRIRASFRWKGFALSPFSRKQYLADAKANYVMVLNDTVPVPTRSLIDPLLHHPERSILLLKHEELLHARLRMHAAEAELAGKSEADFLATWERLEKERVAPSIIVTAANAHSLLNSYGNDLRQFLSSNRELPPRLIQGMKTVSSTSLSVRGKLPLDTRFDVLILDEASQSTIVSALPLLYRAKRAIIIGDERQLQPVVTSSELDHQVELHRHWLDTRDDLEPWLSKKSSILTLAQHHLRTNSSAFVMLRDHHRCDPRIIGYSNKFFYNSQLRIRTAMSVAATPSGITFDEVFGEETDKVNSTEVRRVAYLIDALLKKHNLKHKQIGVVTPFRAQKDAINAELRRLNLREGPAGTIDVDTAHGFQGRECDVMIYSLVVTRDTAAGRRTWANASDDAAHLINVAITRARQFLILVGDPEGTSGYTSDLMNWAKKAGHSSTATENQHS